MTKTKWIGWRSGNCPVPHGTVIRVRFRNGGEFTWPAERFRWVHTGQESDVIAYRMLEAGEAEQCHFAEAPSTTPPGPVSALDTQVAGNHYKDMAIQPVEFIHANSIPYLEGNVIKYVSRWRKKNGIADLEKAKHFIELLIQLEGNAK